MVEGNLHIKFRKASFCQLLFLLVESSMDKRGKPYRIVTVDCDIGSYIEIQQRIFANVHVELGHIGVTFCGS